VEVPAGAGPAGSAAVAKAGARAHPALDPIEKVPTMRRRPLVTLSRKQPVTTRQKVIGAMRNAVQAKADRAVAGVDPEAEVLGAGDSAAARRHPIRSIAGW